MLLKIVLFLFLNFGALAIGGLFTTNGVNSDWYLDINKAPWTPPGWVFGFAWTSIMICFSIYMAYLWNMESKKTIGLLFAIQWILNVIWNPIFFKYNAVLLGLVCIVSLTLFIGFFLFKYQSNLGLKSLLILPYFLWLLIASSLNAYIFFMN